MDPSSFLTWVLVVAGPGPTVAGGLLFHHLPPASFKCSKTWHRSLLLLLAVSGEKQPGVPRMLWQWGSFYTCPRVSGAMKSDTALQLLTTAGGKEPLCQPAVSCRDRNPLLPPSLLLVRLWLTAGCREDAGLGSETVTDWLVRNKEAGPIQ